MFQHRMEFCLSFLRILNGRVHNTLYYTCTQTGSREQRPGIQCMSIIRRFATVQGSSTFLSQSTKQASFSVVYTTLDCKRQPVDGLPKSFKFSFPTTRSRTRTTIPGTVHNLQATTPAENAIPAENANMCQCMFCLPFCSKKVFDRRPRRAYNT